MRVYSGKSVFGGIAIGKIRIYGEVRVNPIKTKDPEAEAVRCRKAVSAAFEQLGELHQKALRKTGKAGAAVFEIHRMMLEDRDYQEFIENIIRTQGVNAEYAVAQAADHFAGMFLSIDDEYMQGRAADVRDISGRLIRILRGETAEGTAAAEPVIIVADDIAPSQAVLLDRDKVVSFVAVRGSLYSHSAIFARTMGIPALVCTREMPLEETMDGMLGIVDGTEGKIYVDPDEETIKRLEKAIQEAKEEKELLQMLKGKKNVTLDGQKIELYANISNIKDLAAALQNDAGGIGLFRSEFIYLERDNFPTEEEQFLIYRTAAEAMKGKRVIIRTLDIGADKQCGYFGIEKEENPALGLRGIRVCLARPEIFKVQLRALLRASAYGRLGILYPMITSVKEVRKIKEIAEEAKRELEERGAEYGSPEQGIMIETPAAAVISDLLAGEVDFFSIGTNDLTQYLLAADRQNGALDEFCDTHHPAVLRMIGLVVENAHKAGIRAGICGELGADPELTGKFLAMGVDELSVSPERILPIRRTILETRAAEYKKTGS